jgi:hypothetical protein
LAFLNVLDYDYGTKLMGILNSVFAYLGAPWGVS